MSESHVRSTKCFVIFIKFKLIDNKEFVKKECVQTQEISKKFQPNCCSDS